MPGQARDQDRQRQAGTAQEATMSTEDGGQDAAIPDVPYDPALSTRAFMDWRDIGRKPGGTGKRGVWAFLRDNLVARPPGNAARSGRPMADPDETHSP